MQQFGELPVLPDRGVDVALGEVNLDGGSLAAFA
jgi:hypothetical protein